MRRTLQTIPVGESLRRLDGLGALPNLSSSAVALARVVSREPPEPGPAGRRNPTLSTNLVLAPAAPSCAPAHAPAAPALLAPSPPAATAATAAAAATVATAAAAAAAAAAAVDRPAGWPTCFSAAPAASSTAASATAPPAAHAPAAAAHAPAAAAHPRPKRGREVSRCEAAGEWS